MISLEVAAIDGDFHSLERVLTRPVIPIKRSNIGQQCELKQWRHLEDSNTGSRRNIRDAADRPGQSIYPDATRGTER